MSNHSETLKTRRYLDLTIDEVAFRVQSLTAREKIQMNAIAFPKDKTKESREDSDLRWGAAVVGFCCVDGENKRLFGPGDIADKAGWKVFADDFADWDAGTADTLVDAIAKHTKLNRPFEATLKNSEPMPISDSP